MEFIDTDIGFWIRPLKGPFLMEKWWKNNDNDDKKSLVNYDDDDQTLEKISIDFTKGHLWSIITPYLERYDKLHSVLVDNCLLLYRFTPFLSFWPWNQYD